MASMATRREILIPHRVAEKNRALEEAKKRKLNRRCSRRPAAARVVAKADRLHLRANAPGGQSVGPDQGQEEQPRFVLDLCGKIKQ